EGGGGGAGERGRGGGGGFITERTAGVSAPRPPPARGRPARPERCQTPRNPRIHWPWMTRDSAGRAGRLLHPEDQREDDRTAAGALAEEVPDLADQGLPEEGVVTPGRPGQLPQPGEEG